jgi:hypothetical protein
VAFDILIETQTFMLVILLMFCSLLSSLKRKRFIIDTHFLCFLLLLHTAASFFFFLGTLQRIEMANVAAPDVKAQPINASNPEENAFHQLFSQIPTKEKLVQSCNCGLIRRKLVRMGRMYVTPLRICFTSSFIGEPLIIQLEDVLTFEKKTSFLCNTIVVITKVRAEYDFTAFLSTGVTQMFNLLKTLWSVREKYAADRASSISAGDESDSASSASFRTNSVGSSASRSRAREAKDTESLQGSHSRSVSIGAKGNGRQESEMSVGSQCSAARLASPGAKERSILADTPLDRAATPEKRKSTVGESNDEVRAKAVPEFRRFFPSLPPSESVIDSFTCCYQFGASRLGKMWITQDYILFVSPMMESKLEINFEDVSKVEKEQKLVLLDGFCVRLKNGESNSFSNFPSRDAALKVVESTFKSFQTAKSAQKNEQAVDVPAGPLVFRTSTCENNESKMPSVASMDAFSQVDTDYGTALSAYSCFQKEVITPVKLPVGKGVLDVFGLCFDDSSSLLEQYHTERKDTDQKWEPWRATKDGGAFRGQRQFTCTTLVKAMLNKPYTYVEYERYALFKVGDAPTLAVQFSSQVPGVMFGDAFRVEALVTFTQSGSGGRAEVTMRAYGYVQFLKSVWVKGRIMSTTMNTELPEGYSVLGKMIESRLKKHQEGREKAGEGSISLSTAKEADSLGQSGSSECAPYAPLLYPVWPMKDRTANFAIFVLATFCFAISLCCCLVMGFSPIGAFGMRGVLQSLITSLTSVITAVICFVSFQIGAAAWVAL